MSFHGFLRAAAAAAALILAQPAAPGQAPNTFCNPLDLVVPGERAYRGGEPVVLIHQDDYYLFVSHRKGYWYSPDFKDWTYVDAPGYPGGVVSVVEKDGVLIGCSMNNRNVYRCLDPKAGKWELAGTLDSDRYGDANLYVDDDGRLYLYYGWSQLMPIKVVELDPVTFKEKSEPKVLFFSDYRNHGFEKRTNGDVIWSIFGGRRDYFEEEYPWIEGPWMTKHGGKYYLQYAAIGLELLSYSHGVYVGDSPTGPFTYSPHNPLTFKTTGFAVGAGHGSTFHDKNGQLWTICMIPASYGGGHGSELAIFPTAVDADGVMHSDVAFGDYPQYLPGMRTDAVDHNWTGWKLLSHKKRVSASSTLEGYAPGNAVDENFLTNWAAATGEPGEWFQVDLGKVADIYAIQCNFDHVGAQAPARGGIGAPAPALPEYYQCYTVEVSQDGAAWARIIDRSENKLDLHHAYTELPEPVQARYVRVTNARTCHDGAKFSIKDLRIFGNPHSAGSVRVEGVKVVRNPEDRREAQLLWDPVAGADGYVIRYGIEPGKLYNSYIVYDDNAFKLHSLNTASDYCFEVESFDSGLDYYRPRSEEINGTGGEVEINKRVQGQRGAGYGGNAQTKRVMVREGVDEYVFEGIDPGYWVINHTFGPVLWAGELTAADLVGEGEPGIEAKLTEMGTGTQVTAEMWMKVVRGPQTGKVVLQIRRQGRRGFRPQAGGGARPAPVASPVVHPDNTVTFNYQDANAKSVKVNTQFAGTQEMARDANGVWTVTLGPVAPDMYPYSFVVDGVQVMDPLNPDWFPNETFKNSILDVRGTGEPLVHALKDVPHGAMDYVNYWSESLGVYGNAIVYTPPRYDRDKKKRYPVFYLISGTTDTEEVYFKVGRVNLILDNLIAAGQAREMIVVLPYGNPSKYYPAGQAPRTGDLFTTDLIGDLMPFVEKNYRTVNDRDHRAIGGFSRGGNQGLAAGLTHLDKFSWLCSYSSFTSMTLPGDVYDDPAINDKIHLFWLGVGTDDFLYGNAKEYMDFLDAKGIRNVKEFTTDKFGHTWMNAKYFLDKSLPLLFQE